MNLETLKNVLLCPLFYAICPPFLEALSGNPKLSIVLKVLMNVEEFLSRHLFVDF
jgi:hypothetical protein